ncbi:MAG: NADH:ubiquinone oxidoreductase subunit NDUFA12 [Alphaproteobacteria bacterium]
MGLFSFLGVLSPAHISLFTMTSRGKKVGTDQWGNTYYEAPARKGYKRPRRWVMYKGKPDASAVPPEWHGWLHHQHNTVPNETDETYRRDWQQPHQPNMTGTNHAYRPPGHILSDGERQKATGDYEAWSPSE